MKEIRSIIQELIEKREPFKLISNFSDKPGIYAVFYYGEKFPLDKEISADEIIYIGKTESSQQSRDADTHFKSGKSGSSTLRRSLGALLRNEFELIPIPRNKVDYQKGRYSHFKFDPESEEKLTSWMVDNLSLSFYEYDKPKKEIESLETELISDQIPILNLQKNDANTYKSIIQKLKKECAVYARTNSIKKEILENLAGEMDQSDSISLDSIQVYASTTDNSKKSEGKYIDLWKSNRDRIIAAIEKTKWGSHQIQMKKVDFENVGNRDNYSFNLELNKMEVVNNIGGSAVARDLNQVLRGSAKAVKLLASGYFKFNMNRAFILQIIRKG